MKILGIVASPREEGNTEILVKAVLKSAEEVGAQVDLLSLHNKKISPCDGCMSCEKTKKCRIIDDEMKDIYGKLIWADGIIFGSPVYFWNVSAQAKILIDRSFLFRHDRNLKGKMGGGVVVANRMGCTSALNAINSFFLIHRIIPVGYVRGFGLKKGDVEKDRRAFQEAEQLGRNIVLMLSYGKEVRSL